MIWMELFFFPFNFFQIYPSLNFKFVADAIFRIALTITEMHLKIIKTTHQFSWLCLYVQFTVKMSLQNIIILLHSNNIVYKCSRLFVCRYLCSINHCLTLNPPPLSTWLHVCRSTATTACRDLALQTI